MFTSRAALIAGVTTASGAVIAEALIADGYYVYGIATDSRVKTLHMSNYRGVKVRNLEAEEVLRALSECRKSAIPLGHVVHVATYERAVESAAPMSVTEASTDFKTGYCSELAASYVVARCAFDWLCASSGDRSITFVADRSRADLLTEIGAPYAMNGIRLNCVEVTLTEDHLRSPDSLVETHGARTEVNGHAGACRPDDVAEAVLGLTRMRQVTQTKLQLGLL
jgi:hypothetical protein